MARILVFGTDKISLILARRHLIRGGHEVFCSTATHKFMQFIAEFQPDVVVADDIMVGIGGMIMYRAIRQKFGNEISMVICSDMHLRGKEEDDPNLRYCPKLPDARELLKAVQDTLQVPAGLDEKKTLILGAGYDNRR